MTYEQWKAYLKAPEPPHIEAPKDDLNPDDFIVWGEGEFERALAELDALEASNNTLSGSLTDAGFGSVGPL